MKRTNLQQWCEDIKLQGELTVTYAKLRKQIERDLKRAVAKPCTCENNGDLCDACDSREALRVLTRREDALKLARAKGKLAIRMQGNVGE